MIYAVVDTNVILSSFITHNHDAATVKVVNYLLNKDVIPLYNDDILAEYRDVLSRKKFNIDDTVVHKVINFFRANGLYVYRHHFDLLMPDEEDRVFYEVCLSKDDSFLVTGNLKHFPVTPRIISPADFVRLIESKAKG